MRMQLMHQLSAETRISMLAAEPGSLLLLASAQDAGRPTRCVAMHSLDPEHGLFESRGRVPLPPIGCPVPKTATLMQHKPQVQRLPPHIQTCDECISPNRLSCSVSRAF